MTNTKLKFSYIDGNPPYNASGIILNKPSHKKFYDALGSGGKHGSLAFLMKAVDNIEKNGKICYIIPTNGMVLENSIGFREYISSTCSITYLWITNKDVFRNKQTNKLEACIQGNTFIIQLTKSKNLPCVVETEYSSGLSFKAETNYSKYNSKYFPLILSELAESAMNKNIHGNGIRLDDILLKGAMHNNISNTEIKFTDSPPSGNYIKVMAKLNRGENIKYGWTEVEEGKNRFLWKVVFSPICKIKEILQYGKISSAIIPSGVSVQTNYSYLKSETESEALYIQKCLSHPLIVISITQLFDNAYINNSNLGKLNIPPYDENIQDIDSYIWDFYKITFDEKTEVKSLYNLIYMTEKSQMKKVIIDDKI